MRTSIISCKCGDLQQMVTDPECGEVVCSKCGLVSADRTPESRAEWRSFDSDRTQVRTGQPSSLAQSDMGLSTVIGHENKDSSGRRLDASVNATIQRIRKWDSRSKSRSSNQKNLIDAFNELARLRGKLILSDAIIEKTAYLYRKAQEKELVKGRSRSSILAAAIYLSCRELGASKSLREIASGTFVKRKDISRSYRLLILGLDIKVPIADPAKCVVKIANLAGISEKTKRGAITSMDDIVKAKSSAGKNPMGLAAAVLYITCVKNVEAKSQKEIADAAGVTEVTIRNRVRELKTRLKFD